MEYIGIGELELPPSYKLPPLHILLSQENNVTGNNYNALNLEFDITCCGNSPADVMHKIKEMLQEYADYTIKNLNSDTLSVVASQNESLAEWTIYRKMLFQLTYKERLTTVNRAQKSSYTLEAV